jgi:acetyl esterase
MSASHEDRSMPLDADSQALLARIASSTIPGYELLTAPVARQFYDAGRPILSPDPEDVAEVIDKSIPGPNGPIPLRIYRPVSTLRRLPVLVYLHGGGWVLGNLQSVDSLCRALANASGHLLVSVDYRLAPEHPFPQGLNDAYAAVCWAAEHAASIGGNPEHLAVGGDSAGGNFSAVIALRARDERGPRLAYQMLIYPATDFSMRSDSQRAFADGYLLTRANQAWFHRHYLDGYANLGDWRLSPAQAADFSGLPPAYVLTAQFDPLRDEGEDYAMLLIKAGVPVTAWRIPGQIHGFITMGRVLPAARVAIDALAHALRAAAPA